MEKQTDETYGVSVVMPAYNAAATIQRAIDSVIGQSYGNWELIVVNDCSSDETADILKKYSDKYQQIHIITNEINSGVAYARNRGVQAAKNEWIAFLDSDDYWETEKLEQQLAMIKKHPDMKMCFTASAFIDEKGRKSEYILHVPEKVVYEELLKQNIISCSSVLITRDLMTKYPMISKKEIHEDFVTWLKILKEIPYAVGVDRPLLIYQLSAKSKSGNKLKAAKMQWNSYRVCEVPLVKSINCFNRYAYRNILKYKEILAGNTG